MALDIMAAFTNEPPELDFIWPGFLAGTVGALVAPGATGKSFFALEAAMSIACSVAGGDLVGLAPAHTGRVVYLAGEDPQPALVRRVHAIGQHLNQSAREAIAENLMLEPIMGKRLNVMDEAHLRRVIDYSAGARLIVLDTLSRIHSLDENSMALDIMAAFTNEPPELEPGRLSCTCTTSTRAAPATARPTSSRQRGARLP